ncbi:MAG: hemerythrin family protein [Gallionella sp.]|nr:hemerythrin family protein [Gallionella sp.]
MYFVSSRYNRFSFDHVVKNGLNHFLHYLTTMLTYPQVALDFMNRDHAEFAAMYDHILCLLTQDKADEAIEAALSRLFQYTQHHFAEEEQAMQAAQFPPYPMHKMEHDRVLAILAQQVSAWQQMQDVVVLREFFEVALTQWFTQHVGMMDKVTAQYIAQHASLN